MQRHSSSIVPESASSVKESRDRNTNTAVPTRRKRRKQQATVCSGVSTTEILVLGALAAFILVCALVVGKRVFDALDHSNTSRRGGQPDAL
jgi:hypothetical protein